MTQSLPIAGVGPAGFSPLSPLSPKQVSVPPRAMNYDPSTRDFTTTNGLYDAIHPVDQAVIMALTIERGSVKSVPDFGIPISTIRRAGGPDLDRKARDCVALALKDLVDARKVKVVRVDTDVAVRGQVKIAVTYQNLVNKRIGTVQTG